jgi:hypothetical protein
VRFQYLLAAVWKLLLQMEIIYYIFPFLKKRDLWALAPKAYFYRRRKLRETTAGSRLEPGLLGLASATPVLLAT